MPPAHPHHAGIRAVLSTAPLPPGLRAELASVADRIVLSDRMPRTFEKPRIELDLEALIAAETAIALSPLVKRGQVSAVLVHHRGEGGLLTSPLHRLEIRLNSGRYRDSVWNFLAARGIRGIRWLPTPCSKDLNTYAVVQGPITAEQWPKLELQASQRSCTHLVLLGARAGPRSMSSFVGSCESLAPCWDHGVGNQLPLWLETAALTFIGEEKALEREALELLFGKKPRTTVLPAPRQGFLRRRDRSWQTGAGLEFDRDDRCLLSPGPYRVKEGMVVICPALGRVSFHGHAETGG